jgi:hypothetical protein
MSDAKKGQPVECRVSLSHARMMPGFYVDRLTTHIIEDHISVRGV